MKLAVPMDIELLYLNLLLLNLTYLIVHSIFGFPATYIAELHLVVTLKASHVMLIAFHNVLL